MLRAKNIPSYFFIVFNAHYDIFTDCALYFLTAIFVPLNQIPSFGP